MDKDIIKMQSLLEKDYNIVKISTNYQNGIVESTISLEKQSKRETIKSKSNDFYKVVSRFKKVKNIYNNDEFVYIKDIDHFNRAVDSSLRNIQHASEGYIFKLSGRSFSEGIIAFVSRSKSPSPKTTYKRVIDIERNPEFLKCDLKDELEILSKINDDIIFRGFIRNYSFSDKKATIVAQDISLQLENTKIQGMEFHNMSFT
jgi:hypothetical protein